MSLSVYTRFFTLGALVLFSRLLWNRLSGHRRLPHPPGPKGWPVIGNLLDIPKEKAHEAYVGMGLKYQSDMLYLNAAGTSMLVLNSVNAANDLLVERWRLYSDRPPMPMTFLCGFDYTFVIFPYGEKWRKYRSLFMREISLSNLAVYHKPRLQQNMEMFLQSLLDSPRNFGDHVDLLYGGSLLSLAYGMSIKDPQDYFLNLIRESQHVASEVSKPGTYIVDIFPMLKYLPAWLPGMGFQRVAASYTITGGLLGHPWLLGHLVAASF
ncbi:hypothetical protein D9757_008810 [Collybiopsis confluens]|uniref:Cytochrome P450 n=1 Tax=Collybiopsis confluens TaxID=2823264 RepID=A0A8H5H3D4_9AGAR|nr:hypothetical protein D9757_008810 [Collybiopsis confluens]